MGYLALAEAEPERFMVIDGAAGIGEVGAAHPGGAGQPCLKISGVNRHVQTDARRHDRARNAFRRRMLFAGLEGLGKATLARRFAARLLGSPEKIEHDDLSLPENSKTIAAREKLPADKRNDDPLFFGTHPDFLTFPPDGPLRQIGIPQMRLLKERAQFKPLHGNAAGFPDRSGRPRRRTGRQLAAQDTRRAARSSDPDPDGGECLRSAADHPLALGGAEFFAAVERGHAGLRAGARARQRGAAHRAFGREPRGGGSLDIELYQKRRASMLALLKTGAGASSYAAWLPISETLGRSKSEKLELHLKLLYDLLRDI